MRRLQVLLARTGLHYSTTPLGLTRPTVGLFRPFATSGKPDWMAQAEAEAIAATNARAAQGTANDHMMSKLAHEFQGERISSAVKLSDKLNDLIAKCHAAKPGAVDERGRKVYNTLRKKALQTRQDLITQKEAAGMTTDATSVVESAFPIPASV